jgi:hypothetical protein
MQYGNLSQLAPFFPLSLGFFAVSVSESVVIQRAQGGHRTDQKIAAVFPADEEGEGQEKGKKIPYGWAVRDFVMALGIQDYSSS